jgi:outer membrane protein with beta-barrel domain
MQRARIPGKTAGIPAIAFAALLTLLLPQSVTAQEMPRAAAEISFGWIGFADDGIVSETPIGGAVRWHLTPRLSVGPEVLWITGSNHSHLVLTGNMTFDFLGPANGRAAPVTPFIVVGGGMFQTTESFVNGDDFTSTEGAFTVGGGVRANPTNRMTFGIDARLGWETHIRLTGFIGVRF